MKAVKHQCAVVLWPLQPTALGMPIAFGLLVKMPSALGANRPPAWYRTMVPVMHGYVLYPSQKVPPLKHDTLMSHLICVKNAVPLAGMP